MPQITIYTREFCGFCMSAKALLERRGLAFTERNASEDATARAEMLARANGRMTFPQIFIGDVHVGGCDDLFALDRSGGLTKLVAEQSA